MSPDQSECRIQQRCGVMLKTNQDSFCRSFRLHLTVFCLFFRVLTRLYLNPAVNKITTEHHMASGRNSTGKIQFTFFSWCKSQDLCQDEQVNVVKRLIRIQLTDSLKLLQTNIWIIPPSLRRLLFLYYSPVLKAKMTNRLHPPTLWCVLEDHVSCAIFIALNFNG